jgi:hypothetical protein
VLAGQSLGIREVDDGIWLAGFMHYDLGYFDLEQKTLQPLDNPFGTRLSPMSQVRGVTYVSGPDNQRAGGEGDRQTIVQLRSSLFTNVSIKHEIRALFDPFVFLGPLSAGTIRRRC